MQECIRLANRLGENYDWDMDTQEGGLGLGEVEGMHSVIQLSLLYRYYVYLAFYLRVLKHLWLREWQKKTTTTTTEKPNRKQKPKTIQ